MSPFEALIGQERAVELLTQATAKQRIAPAYLFAGPTGVGRSLAAYCFTKWLFQQYPTSKANLASLPQRVDQHNHPDLLWVEPTYLHQGKRLTVSEAIAVGGKRKTPPIIRLEQIREIGQFLSRSALETRHPLVVVEQAESMAEAPANALLKTLEEPGPATLILIAQSAESLLPTLVSRCQRIPFSRLSTKAMRQIIQATEHGELLQNAQILQLAEGSPGAAIAHWQQLQTIPAELLQQLAQPPRSHRAALTLAQQIDQQLELDSQLWLINYLQQIYWQADDRSGAIAASSRLTHLRLLEKARVYLLQNVNARLVWEVTLMGMLA